MNRKTLFVGTLALGAGLMYILDPQLGRGRRRRAVDRLLRAKHRSEETLRSATRDLRNRASGVTAEVAARLRHEPVDDDLLLSRVRSRLGRATSHPRAISISVADGLVTMKGPVRAHELANVRDVVRSTRGVTNVIDLLEPHAEPDLQILEGGREIETRPVLLRRWTPAARLVAGVAGSAVVAAAIATTRYGHDGGESGDDDLAYRAEEDDTREPAPWVEG